MLRTTIKLLLTQTMTPVSSARSDIETFTFVFSFHSEYLDLLDHARNAFLVR